MYKKSYKIILKMINFKFYNYLGTKGLVTETLVNLGPSGWTLKYLIPEILLSTAATKCA